MSLSFVNEIGQDVEFVQSFTGYNHNLRCGQGQFYDMENMTGDYAPVLSTRGKRTHLNFEWQGIYPEPTVFCKDYIYIIAGENIFWGEDNGQRWEEVDRIIGCVTAGKKQIADIGSKVLILPDWKIFDIETHTISDAGFSCVYESREEEVYEGHTYVLSLKFTPSTLEGDPITYVADDEAPQDTDAYWYNTTDKKVYRYNSALSMWQVFENCYVRVQPTIYSSTGTDSPPRLSQIVESIEESISTLNDYDTVEIQTAHVMLDTDYVVQYAGGDYFTVAGIIQSEAQSFIFTLQTRKPDMQFITSMNNRIWGCSSDGREIYASKLGDPSQWYNYAGLSSDSFAATIGSDGNFTGAVAYNNSVLFFKKDRMHKVMGNFPSNFQVAEYTVNGVAEGCSKSLQVVNGYLFYLGEEDVMIYDGSLPRSCSDEFGSIRLSKGVAGKQMNKYYLSAVDSESVQHLFVYDTETRQWWKEDDIRIVTMATHFNELYYMECRDGLTEGAYVYRFFKAVGEAEDDFEWFVESGDLGLETPYQKYISKIQIRMAFEGEVYVEISYEGGLFKEVFRKSADRLRSYTVPIVVKRCDHFRIRIGGIGTAKIYSIGYNVETGSEKC